MAVTGHYVRDYELKMSPLDFLEAAESHTVYDLSKLLLSEIIHKYPQLKFICCVADSTTTMIKTAKNLNTLHILCFLHRVQTTVNKAKIAFVSNSKDMVNLTITNPIMVYWTI